MAKLFNFACTAAQLATNKGVINIHTCISSCN